MGSRTVRTQEKTSGTTTPVVPQYAQPAVSNFYTGATNFGNAVNTGQGASWLPQTNVNMLNAFAGGGNLTRTNTALNDAAGFARQAYDMTGQADSSMPDPMQLTRAGDMAGLDELGDGSQYNIDPAQIAALTQAQGARGSDYMRDYLDPMMEDIIGAMEAEYDDDIGQQSAALEAEAMMNKGFGGSGYALRQGEFDADATRGRNALRGQLRTNMWNTAIGAGANDAALAGQVGMFNAGQANQQAGQQAGFDQQARINNSGIGAQFGLSRFNAANQFGLADAAAANQMESQRFGTEADMNQFNANRRLQENAQRMAGAGLMGDMAQSQTQDQLSRLQGLLSLGQAQYGTDLASSPYGQLLALGGLLNPDGVLNTVTGNQFEGTSSGTQKSSGGFMGDLLLAMVAGGSRVGSAMAGGG